MRKLRWGVLSTAKIAVEKVVPAMQQGRHTEVTALASRDLARARSAAERLGVAKAYGSYGELLDDPEIDAVYNPLPNHLHVPWSLRALAAGKHVLCEKPIALTAAEAQTLLDAAGQHPHLKVMEAFMYRHHPQWQRVVELVDGGAIGELRTLHSVFSYYNADPANIRNVAEIGGGGLMDIGCYNLSVSRFVFAAEPERVCGALEYDATFGTDRLASGILEFGRGTATFTCSTQLVPFQRVDIFGTEGRIEVEVPFSPQPHQPSRIWHQHDGRTDELLIEPYNQYTLQGDRFSRAVLEGTEVPTPLEDAVANMRVLEAVVASARSERWVRVSPPKTGASAP
jgi:predicted dehydrogenase